VNLQTLLGFEIRGFALFKRYHAPSVHVLVVLVQMKLDPFEGAIGTGNFPVRINLQDTRLGFRPMGLSSLNFGLTFSAEVRVIKIVGKSAGMA
jgi:hypothetical protein